MKELCESSETPSVCFYASSTKYLFFSCLTFFVIPQIKSDVETKGHLINHLIEKVQSASFTNMEEVLSFVDWLDGELSTLVLLINKFIFTLARLDECI